MLASFHCLTTAVAYISVYSIFLPWQIHPHTVQSFPPPFLLIDWLTQKREVLKKSERVGSSRRNMRMIKIDELLLDCQDQWKNGSKDMGTLIQWREHITEGDSRRELEANDWWLTARGWGSNDGLMTSWDRNWIKLETIKDDKLKTWNYRAWIDEQGGLMTTGAEAWQHILFQVERNTLSRWNEWWQLEQHSSILYFRRIRIHPADGMMTGVEAWQHTLFQVHWNIPS